MDPPRWRRGYSRRPLSPGYGLTPCLRRRSPATTYQGTKYIALLEFSFSVEEYLKGSGAEDIVAVWAAAPFFDTQEEAEDALPAIVAARDAQWGRP